MKYSIYLAFLFLFHAWSVLADTSIVFLGALLPEESQEYVKKIQNEIKEKGLNLKATLPNKMHVTIKYIGNYNEQDREDVVEKIKEALSGIKLDKIKVKPTNLSKGGLVLLHLDSTKLRELHDTVDSLLAEKGFKTDKNYRPHITIGRLERSDNNTVASAMKDINEMIEKDDRSLDIDAMKLLALPKEHGFSQYFYEDDYEKLLGF